MRQWTWGLLAAIAIMTAAVTAKADPFPVSTLFADFNVITNGNFATNSDADGQVLVGGNLSGNGQLDKNGSAQACCTTPVPNYAEVNVFGNNTGSWSGIGSIRALVGGTNSGTFHSPPYVLIATGYTFPGFNQPGAGSNAATFANDIWAPLTGTSSTLSTLAANSTFNSTTGVLNGVAGPNGAVFSIPLSTLNGFTGTLSLGGCLALSTPCDAVINVTGTGSFAQAFAFPTADQQPGLPNILFNFVSASGVAYGAQYFEASILAPFAVASNNGTNPLVGDLFASSVSATAPLGNEIHYAPFDCSDNLCSSMTGPPNGGVPEPTSLGLLAAGLGAFAAIRRRRA